MGYHLKSKSSKNQYSRRKKAVIIILCYMLYYIILYLHNIEVLQTIVKIYIVKYRKDNLENECIFFFLVSTTLPGLFAHCFVIIMNATNEYKFTIFLYSSGSKVNLVVLKAIPSYTFVSYVCK